MSTEPLHRSLFRVLRSGLLSIASLVGVAATPAQALPNSIDPARDALAARVQRVRDALADPAAAAKDDAPAGCRLAQWGNWPNWPNWGNWNNWQNWGNWHKG